MISLRLVQKSDPTDYNEQREREDKNAIPKTLLNKQRSRIFVIFLPVNEVKSAFNDMEQQIVKSDEDKSYFGLPFDSGHVFLASDSDFIGLNFLLKGDQRCNELPLKRLNNQQLAPQQASYLPIHKFEPFICILAQKVFQSLNAQNYQTKQNAGELGNYQNERPVRKFVLGQAPVMVDLAGLNDVAQKNASCYRQLEAVKVRTDVTHFIYLKQQLSKFINQ